MLRQEITYKDYNGNTRTEIHHFNLTEDDLLMMELSYEHGLQFEMQSALDGKSYKELLVFIKNLISKSYGIKSEDGRFHRKSPEIIADFENSALYSDFLLSLFEDKGAKGQAFITGLMPAELVRKAEAKATGVKSDVEPNARERFEAHQRDRNVPSVVVEEPTTAAWGTESDDKDILMSNQVAMDESLRKDFEEWKAARDAEANTSRPPHESGPGAQFNG